HRLVRIDDRRQRLVLDHDRFAGVLGDIGVVGDDAGDLLALEAHLVGREDGLGVVREGRHPGQVAGGHHLARAAEAYAGAAPRLAGSCADAPRRGEGAPQGPHVPHARQPDVIGVAALAADEPVVLDALAAGAEPANLYLIPSLRHDHAPVWLDPAWDCSF